MPLKYRQPYPLSINEPLMLPPAKSFPPPQVPDRYKIEYTGIPNTTRQIPVNVGNNLSRPNVQGGINLPPLKNNVLNEPVQLTQSAVNNLSDMGSKMASGIVDSMYDGIYNSVKTGKWAIPPERAGLLEQVVDRLSKQGKINSVEDIKFIARELTSRGNTKEVAFDIVNNFGKTQPITSKYTPEIQRKLDDIDNKIKMERDYQYNLVSRGMKNKDEVSKEIKGVSMRLSAKKREIIQGDSLIPVEGGLTQKELNNKIDKLRSNYSGKEVITPDGEGKLVGQSSFGKVGVRVNGNIKYYPKEQIQSKVNIDDVILQQKKNNTSNKLNENNQGGINLPPLKNNSLNEPLNNNQLPPLKNRQFIENSFLNSEVPTPKMKAEMKQNIPQYEPLTNKSTLDNANAKINKVGYEQSKNDFLSAQKLIDAEDTATGQALIQKAIASGKYAEANDIAINLAEKLTNAGQTVQAASIFKRMTPEGMLQYGNKVINKANKEIQAKAGNKVVEKIKFTPEEVKFITNTMEEINKANNGELELLDINLQLFADGKLAEVMKLIASKIPANLGEKIKAYQRINLLLNPKTMIRNLAGNVISSGVANVKDVLATGIDKGVSKLTGERTMLLPSLKTQIKGGKTGYNRVIRDYKQGVNTSPVGTQYEIDGRIISPFKNKIMMNLDEVTKTGLRLADDPFYQSAYDDVLRREMKLKGVNSPTPEMIAKADTIARERTFQDTNRITELFTLIQRGLNRIGTKNFGLGNIVIPFVKTPANILARALEYSPVELAKVTKQLYNAASKNGNFDQYKFVDSLAKSISGTALIGAGYELAQKGIISGAASKDKDARNFANTVGILPYSFKVGGKTYTYDWAQPSSIPIAMGADIYYNLKKSKNPDNVLIESAKSGFNTLFSQSLLQGLNKMFGGSSFGGGDMAENLTNTALSATSQFIPLGSLQRQIGEIADPYKREMADESIIKSKVVNPFKNTVLGLRQTLPVKVNTIGTPVKAGGFVDTMLNPARSSDYQGNSTFDELLRLNSQSNENKQFPTTAKDKISYKTSKKGESQNLNLTPDQLASYKAQLGQSNLQAIQKVMSTSAYANGNDKQKADLLSKALSDNKQKVENNFLKSVGIKEYKSRK
jgi:hypothetical protein